MATQAPLRRPPVSDHYLTQTGLTVALSAAIRRLWSDVTAGDSESLLMLRRQVAVLVNQFSVASATVAAQAYSRERLAAGIRSPFTVPLAAGPDAKQVAKSLSWSTRNLQAVPAPADQAQMTTQAQRDMEGAATRLVLNTGRETTVEAVQRDPRARAWAREARPGCCAFCAMLSSRGATYKNEYTAGLAANRRFTGAGEFKFHDHCHCQAVPVFGAYEPTAHARQWAADWQNLKDTNGGSLSLNEWRRHIEGRATQDDPHLAGN